MVGKSALLVEDNSSHAVLIRDELAAVLATAGRSTTAATLAEARRSMAARRYDLYVLDYWLPDGDGIELLREIRRPRARAPTLSSPPRRRPSSPSTP